ncbi:hypothetical protein DRP53_10785, partial [candidate division WOR-3 bacterium]
LLKISGLSGGVRISIFDITGRRVLCGAIQVGDPVIDLSNLKSGVYFLSVEGEEVDHHKFVLLK